MEEAVGKTLGWLRYAVLGMFVAVLAAGVFVPIYTDEVGWRFQERAAFDGVDKLFSDTCGSNTLAAPPFFMMPVRYYSAFFNSLFADPMYVRFSGVLYAFVWLALLVALIGRISRGRRDRAVLTIVGLGLMCLGMVPMLLVWSRPEQPIVLVTTAALLIALTYAQKPGAATTRAAWLRSVALVVLGIIALSYHLKALFVAPVFLACLFFASRGRNANVPRQVMALMFVAIVGFSAAYWAHRMQCPDDPILRAAYADNSRALALTEAGSLAEARKALLDIAGNINLIDYFGLASPRPDPMSRWLEDDQITLPVANQWYVSLILGWSGVTIAAVACIGAGAYGAWRARRLDPGVILASTLLIGVLGWSATQVHRNIYEACLVLPLVMLATVLALSTRKLGGLMDASAEMIAVIVGLCAIASPLAMASIYGPSLLRASRQTGYIAAQPTSLPVFGYASVKPQIERAAARCGIGDPAKAKALLVDELTYFTFMRSRLPQHHLGVLWLWRGEITDPVAYLKSRGSSGAILGCHFLPADLRARAKREGQFCCLGPPNW
jgi:hypothetical protein